MCYTFFSIRMIKFLGLVTRRPTKAVDVGRRSDETQTNVTYATVFDLTDRHSETRQG